MYWPLAGGAQDLSDVQVQHSQGTWLGKLAVLITNKNLLDENCPPKYNSIPEYSVVWPEGIYIYILLTECEVCTGKVSGSNRGQGPVILAQLEHWCAY